MNEIFKPFINGNYVNGQAGEFIRTNPANGEIVGTFHNASSENALQAVSAARTAFDAGVWSDIDTEERAKVLLKFADLLDQHQEELGKLEAASLGAPISNGPSFIQYGARCFRYFAGLARDLHGESFNFSSQKMGLIMHEPAGVASLILPWNFPMGELVWKLAPALAAGCTVVLKPDSKTAATALKAGALLKEAGLPDGVCNIIVGEVAEIGDVLTSDPRVDVVSFTGSTSSGSKIMASAASVNKPVHLELGGKSPLIIMDDCDLDNAVSDAANAVFWHCGQVCTAASRLLVHESIYDEFLIKLTEAGKSMAPGAPNSGAALGSMVSQAHRDEVKDKIDTVEMAGATILLDGREYAQQDNAFLGPTIITDIKHEHPICQEEIFGPVTVVQKITDLDDAIAMANDTKYGLGAGIWTSNLNAALSASKKIKSGSFWINGYGADRLEMPWGGCKQSGFGRELGKYAFELFTNVKSVHINL